MQWLFTSHVLFLFSIRATRTLFSFDDENSFSFVVAFSLLLTTTTTTSKLVVCVFVDECILPSQRHSLRLKVFITFHQVIQDTFVFLSCFVFAVIGANICLCRYICINMVLRFFFSSSSFLAFYLCLSFRFQSHLDLTKLPCSLYFC